MQICTSLRTDNHASTPPLSFYWPDALPAAQPTASKQWRHVVMQSRFYKTVLYPSVCLCTICPPHAALVGWMLWACGRYWSIAACPSGLQWAAVVSQQRANVGSATLSADAGSWTQTCSGKRFTLAYGIICYCPSKLKSSKFICSIFISYHLQHTR